GCRGVRHVASVKLQCATPSGGSFGGRTAFSADSAAREAKRFASGRGSRLILTGFVDDLSFHDRPAHRGVFDSLGWNRKQIRIKNHHVGKFARGKRASFSF